MFAAPVARQIELNHMMNKPLKGITQWTPTGASTHLKSLTYASRAETNPRAVSSHDHCSIIVLS
jgi:hypothetical protein